MCGLYGWIKHPASQVPASTLTKLTACLTMLNNARGDDSAGVAIANQGQSAPILLKAVGTPRDFLKQHISEIEALCDDKVVWLMGHTRSKTVGDVTVDNAHPFKMGTLIGAHNGSINNYAALRVDERRYKLPGCDSAAFFAYADQRGLKQAIRDAFGSLVVTVSQPPYLKIRIYKDNIFGLHIAYVSAWQMAVWSSQEDHLLGALAAVGILLDSDTTGEVGYLTDYPLDTLVTLPAMELTGKTLLWKALHLSSWRAPARGGYGYGYADGAWDAWDGRTTGEQVDIVTAQAGSASTKPIEGGHTSKWGTPDRPYYHAGTIELCHLCTTRNDWPLVKRDPDVVIKGGKGKRYMKGADGKRLLVSPEHTATSAIQSVMIFPTEHSPHGRTALVAWPPVACPDCHRNGDVLIPRPEVYAVECRHCRCWIELVPQDVNGGQYAD